MRDILNLVALIAVCIAANMLAAALSRDEPLHADYTATSSVETTEGQWHYRVRP